jgi:threonine aldolase
MIDLRSDTVTRPTEGMRRAMYEAEVGDDVFGEDPTVRRLQQTVASLLGKEAALFVPSGVMGNQLALKVHTQPGDEVLLEATSHIFNYESGAPGLLSGVVTRTLTGEDGVLTGEQVAAAVRPGYYWLARTRLVCLENTLNQAGGLVYPMENLRAITEVARAHGLGSHLDGARLWNATAATGIPEKDYAAPFDTVSVCLSKGLGAPVGSVLAGPKDLITEAHRYRKMWGGGMRQAGILAAAGLYALEHHRDRLAEDHANARRLAEGIAELPGFSLDPTRVQTNIVIFDVDHGDALRTLGELKAEGVLMVPFGPATIRATTHLDVSMDDVEAALAVMRRLYGRA